jgi:hypothetical protein
MIYQNSFARYLPTTLWLPVGDLSEIPRSRGRFLSSIAYGADDPRDSGDEKPTRGA